ncbi:MAG: hypothetical protein M0Z56_05865 [Desulfobacteraceae bacterium]|nr:hypothetical protein [Desulfobacteraceae bacterium]
MKYPIIFIKLQCTKSENPHDAPLAQNVLTLFFLNQPRQFKDGINASSRETAIDQMLIPQSLIQDRSIDDMGLSFSMPF